MSFNPDVIDQVLPDRDPCPGCHNRARVIRRIAEPPPAALVGRVLSQVGQHSITESRAKVVATWSLCFHCLRREHWELREGHMELAEVLDGFTPGQMVKHDS